MSSPLTGHTISFFFSDGSDAGSRTTWNGSRSQAILGALAENAGALFMIGERPCDVVRVVATGLRDAAGDREILDLTPDWQALISAGTFSQGFVTPGILLIEASGTRHPQPVSSAAQSLHEAMDMACQTYADTGGDPLALSDAESVLTLWDGSVRTYPATDLLTHTQFWLQATRAISDVSADRGLEPGLLTHVFGINCFLDRPVDATAGYYGAASEQPQGRDLVAAQDAVWVLSRNRFSADPHCLSKAGKPMQAGLKLTQKGVSTYGEALWLVHSRIPANADKVPPISDFIAAMNADVPA